MKAIGIIPARYASTRFPGKPLVMLGNQSMVQRVYNQAKLCPQLNDALVATDDQRIYDHVKSWQGNVVMTSPTHVSGTDRCLEAYMLSKSQHEIIINIQGDEPFLNPEAITQLIELFSDAACTTGTLVRKIQSQEELFNPSVVKAVLRKNNDALYFTRNAAPHVRQAAPEEWIRQCTFYAHIGMYGFRSHTLKELCALAPSALEKAESLEQLRWMENGHAIRASITHYISLGIDTPEDLEKAKKSFL